MNIISLKKYYWKWLEKIKLFQKSIDDYITQVKVLSLFFGCFLFKSIISNICRPKTGLSFCSRDNRCVLMISYYSSPYKSNYGTQRLGKFVKYLSKTGWKMILLTTEPGRDRKKAKDPETIPNSVKVIRTSEYELEALKYKKRVIPDDNIAWVIPTIKTVQTLSSNENISLIFATAPPYSNLLVGAICSLILNVPLVSDFRDPWNKIDVIWDIDNPILRLPNKALEKIVLKISSKIIMADEKEYWRQYFSETDTKLSDKIVSITNGFDEEDFLNVKRTKKRRGKFVISYIGNFYDHENFNQIIGPLELWHQRHPIDFTNVVFEYAGQSSKYFNRENKYPFKLIDHGYLSHNDAITLRFNSDLQLFAQPRSFKPHVLSGKIYEMLRVGVPILAITNPSGSVAKLIDKTRTGFVVNQGEYESIANKLKELYEMWRQGEIETHPRKEMVMQYSRENLAKKLSYVLESVI